MTRLLPILAIATIALIAACVPEAGSATPTATASTPAASASSATPVVAPSPSLEPPPSPSTTAGETVSPVSPPSSPEAGASPDAPGTAAACSGSDGNRDFFADAAADLDWPVYCAVLPRGWFVGTGEYRLGNGGYLQITYEGPDDARFELQEGAVCGAVDDCVPAGDGIGDASFGDRTGALVDTGNGDLAIVVGTGEPITWVATGTGIDEALFRELAAAVVEVSD